MRKNLPPVELFLGKTIPQFSGYEILEHIASGSNGHLFRAFDKSINSTLAFKIIPADNLQPDHLEEARKANRLENSSVVSCHSVIEYSFANVPCVIFIYDYVKGKNLRDYIRQDQSNINVLFIENFLRSMFGILHELKERKLTHGDLHAGNILISKSEYDIYGKIMFRVTDFGVGKLSGHLAHPNDYFYVAEILKQLLECVEYQDCEGRDRYVYDILRHDFLERHLTETNPMADQLAMNPQKMLEKLDSLDDQYSAKKKHSASTLVTPFDYPNCEQIGNSHLLLKNLYSDRLLGLSEIQARSNLMLTGPRGCGKTTVFRALSLAYLIANTKDKPDDLDYIGIYYRCDDLYFAFPRYKTPERLEALDVPLHFLIVTLLATALEQIGTWAKEHFPNEFKKKEEALVAELLDLFGWSHMDNPSARQLATLVTRLKVKERKRAANKQRFVHVQTEPIEDYFGPGIMFDSCRLIRNKFSFLRDRPFYFFIDDYSHPKITKNLQANLNRLLMHRGQYVFIK
ncbi:MAG: protein kinase, partial [Nitrospira sp. SB0661_bin_20]|nr:protein kinase [Nitrospira sp. SB0661_bin_20]